MMRLLTALADRACTSRVMGSGTLALSHVAAGRGTGAIISEFHPEDHLAAAFACAEAGLAVRDESGAQQPFPDRGGILVCGVGPATSGLLLAPLGAASMVAMPVSGRLSDRLGARRVAVTGGVVALAGAMLLATQPAGEGLVVAVAGAMLLGLGLGTVGAPAIGSVFRTVPPGSASQGSALLYVFNQVGAALGIAVGALLVGDPAVASIGSFRPGFWLLAAAVVVGLAASTRLPGRSFEGARAPVEASA